MLFCGQINFLKKIRNTIRVQTICIQIRTDALSVLIWIQSVCKSYQSTTKVEILNLHVQLSFWAIDNHCVLSDLSLFCVREQWWLWLDCGGVQPLKVTYTIYVCTKISCPICLLGQFVASLTADPGVQVQSRPGHVLSWRLIKIIFYVHFRPSVDSRRVVVSYKRKYVHKVPGKVWLGEMTISTWH